MNFAVTILSLLIACLADASPATQSAELESEEQVISFIQKNNVRDVETVIQNLSPDLKSNFTFMKKSISLQEASPAFPRAIVFGSSAEFILTFNGRPDHRGFNTIEMMSFDDKSKKFRLREIEFLVEANQPYRISEVNPPKCMRCHQPDPRPIWENYPSWPDAYGEFDDVEESRNEYFGKFKQPVLGSSPEWSRYRHLIYSSDLASPYKAERGYRYFDKRPNHRLGLLLSLLNAKRITQKLKESSSLDRYRDHLIPVLFQCNLIVPRFNPALPDSTLRQFFFALHQMGIGYRQDISLSLGRDIESEIAQGREVQAISLYVAGVFDTIADMIASQFAVELFAPPQRILKKGNYKVDGEPTPSARFIEEMAKIGPIRVETNVCEDYPYVNVENGKPYEIAFAKTPAFEKDYKKKELQFSLNQCMQCHGHSGIAPKIDFLDPVNLGTYKTKNPNWKTEILNRLRDEDPLKRMPPAGLEPYSQVLLEEYFNRL